MAKLRNPGKMAAASAISVFLAAFFIFGIIPRLLGAPPAVRPLAAAQGESAKATSLKPVDLISAEDLVKVLDAPEAKRPLLISVGFHQLYSQAHIPHSEYFGPGSNAVVLQQLRKRLEKLPHSRFIVVYCGCCPWNHCPNVAPAYEALQAWGFTHVKVLYIPNNLGTDWVNKGYPSERGE